MEVSSAMLAKTMNGYFDYTHQASNLDRVMSSYTTNSKYYTAGLMPNPYSQAENKSH